MLSDYSDMEQEIRDTPPIRVLPRGTEVKVRIIQVIPGEGDFGRYYRIRLDIPTEPAAPEITKFINDVGDAKKSGDETNKQKAFRTFDAFTKAFSIDISRPFDWETDLDGLEGWAILGVKKDDEYGDKNTISKFVVGK